MRAACLLIAVLLLASGIFVQASPGRYSIWLSAHPQAVVADSHSSITISAEVRDSTGASVPDGTVVEFTSSLGIIERRSRTVAGVARARLESGTAIGTATVSAVAPDGGAVAELRVDFLEPGTEVFEEAFISMSSKNYLGYDGDRQIIDATGGVRVEHRGVTIEAWDAQFDVKKSVLRAKAKPGDRVVIRRSGKEVYASVLAYDLGSMKGVMLGPIEDGAKRLTFRAQDLLTASEDPSADSPSFDFQPIAESRLFIRAKSILIRPGEDIRFKKATYYIDGERALSVPLQIVPLKTRSSGPAHMLSYGTEGVRLDLPIYYSLTPNAAGAIRLRHSEPSGWGSYSQRAGWQIDLDHEYNFGGAVQGRFTVNRVTSKDWGLRWHHRLLLDDNSQFYSYFDFPAHRDVFGSVDYSRPMREVTWSVSLRGSKYRTAEGGYFIGTYLQTRPKPLVGDAVSCAFSTRVSYDNRQIGARKVGSGVGMQLYGRPIQFSANTNLNTSMSLSRQWGGTDPGLSLFANAGLSHMLGVKGFFGLNYSYAWTSSTYGYNSQSLSANLTFSPSGRWTTGVFSTYSFNDRSISAFGDLSYTFAPLWRFGILTTYQRFRFSKFTDAEFILSRNIGRQELMITYSQSRKRFRLEMNALAF